MKIAVAGTGYVGLSMACLLAQKNEVVASNVVKIRNISSKKIQAYYINFDMRDSWK